MNKVSDDYVLSQYMKKEFEDIEDCEENREIIRCTLGFRLYLLGFRVSELKEDVLNIPMIAWIGKWFKCLS